MMKQRASAAQYDVRVASQAQCGAQAACLARIDAQVAFRVRCDGQVAFRVRCDGQVAFRFRCGGQGQQQLHLQCRSIFYGATTCSGQARLHGKIMAALMMTYTIPSFFDPCPRLLLHAQLQLAGIDTLTYKEHHAEEKHYTDLHG